MSSSSTVRRPPRRPPRPQNSGPASSASSATSASSSTSASASSTSSSSLPLARSNLSQEKTEKLLKYIERPFTWLNKEDLDHIESLLKQGADPNHASYDGSPLTRVFRQYDQNAFDVSLDKLLRLLIKYGANPNLMEIGYYRAHPLLVYASQGHIDNKTVSLIAKLLQLGVNPNITAPEDVNDELNVSVGATPLIALAQQTNIGFERQSDFIENIGNYAKVAKVLIMHGADVDATDELGRSALDYVRRHPLFKELRDLLENASAQRKLKRAMLADVTPQTRFAYLEQPGGTRERARRATQTAFSTDIQRKEGLCKELDNELYKTELLELAKDIGLSVPSKVTKKQLCQMLSDYGTRDISI